MFSPKFSHLPSSFLCHSCQDPALHPCCHSDLKNRGHHQDFPSPGPTCLQCVQIIFVFPPQHFQVCMFFIVNSPETFLLPGLFSSYISSFQPAPKAARRGLLTLCKGGTIIGLHLILVLRDSQPGAKDLGLSGGALRAKASCSSQLRGLKPWE